MTSKVSLVPSSKCTTSPSRSETFGFGMMSPEPSRSGSSTDCVGCASNSLWLAGGSPYFVGSAPTSGANNWAALRCQDNGMCGEVLKSLSPGWPAMYFGTIQALDRHDNVSVFCNDFDDSSTVISAALLPIPTTRIRLPVSSNGRWGSM